MPPRIPQNSEATALATMPNIGSYLAATMQPDEMVELIRENMGADHVDPRKLDRAKVPSGGGKYWSIVSLDETPPPAALSGIILLWTQPRVFYKMRLDEGGEKGPPDCSSADGITGVGDPGVACRTCEFNEWDTGKGGKGKACKEYRLLFLLQPHMVLPTIVQVPPTSIAPVGDYMRRLTGLGIRYWSTVTKLSLQETTQKGGGNVYSQIVVTKGEALSKEETAWTTNLRNQLRPILQQATAAVITEADAGQEEEGLG